MESSDSHRSRSEGGGRNHSVHRSFQTISVIIPALDEAGMIRDCVRACLDGPHVIETIVVDGGSRDATCREAVRAGARVVVHDRPVHDGGGRGGQIRAGLHDARGDIVAIVHADCRVSPSAFRAMIRSVNHKKQVAGGVVGCRFDTQTSPKAVGFRCGIIEFLNQARVLATGIGFGDQVQFFVREPVVRQNLFPSLPLMEDVELSLRLKTLGRRVYLNRKALVSPRRWAQKGTSNAFLIMGLVFLYLVRRTTGTIDPSFFYRRYYGIPSYPAESEPVPGDSQPIPNSS